MDYLKEITEVWITDIESNRGQIPGVPKNPRSMSKEDFEDLKESIKESPDMLKLREIILYPMGDKFVAIAGNYRYRACKALGHKTVTCKILKEDTPEEKIREYAIKDNVQKGTWDKGILEAWNQDELYQFGAWKKKDAFTEEFESYNNDNAHYPLIPKFDENNEVFIIVSENEIDANWLRERLGMQTMKSYKSDELFKSNIIHISDVIKALQNSDTEPQKGK